MKSSLLLTDFEDRKAGAFRMYRSILKKPCPISACLIGNRKTAGICGRMRSGWFSRGEDAPEDGIGLGDPLRFGQKQTNKKQFNGPLLIRWILQSQDACLTRGSASRQETARQATRGPRRPWLFKSQTQASPRESGRCVAEIDWFWPRKLQWLSSWDAMRVFLIGHLAIQRQGIFT